MSSWEGMSRPEMCMKEAHQSGKYSDFTIRCGDHSFAVHKVVVCTQSEYFEKTMKPEFQEGHDGVIDLKDDHPEAVEALIRYFYTGNYRDKDSADRDKDSEDQRALQPLLLDAMMVVLSDKYMIPSLQNEALDSFSMALDRLGSWDANTKAFFETVRFVYENFSRDNDRMIKELLVNTTVVNFNLFKLNHLWKNVLKDIPQYSIDVADAFNIDLRGSMMDHPQETLPLLVSNLELRLENKELKFKASNLVRENQGLKWSQLRSNSSGWEGS